MASKVMARPADDVIYRDTPEVPLPQSDWHRDLITLLIEALA